MVTVSLFLMNERHISFETFEKLAKLEHEQWAHWTTYMLANMSEENMARWRIQSATAYCNLSEEDKEKDRKWARKVLEVLRSEDI